MRLRLFGIHLVWGQPRLLPLLADWESAPVAPGVAYGPPPGAHHDHHQVSLGFEEPGEPAQLFEQALNLVMAYQIFPPCVGRPALRRSPVGVGDTLGLFYRPFGPVGMFFASRVAAVVDETHDGRLWRGFTYRTLVNHPELGEESFLVSKDALGEIHFHMKSWSVPGHRLIRLLAPVARWLQNRANRSALDWMRQRVVKPQFLMISE